MKRTFFALMLSLVFASQSFADSCCNFVSSDREHRACDDLYSRTFMFIRPVYEHVVLRNHLWDSIIYSKKGSLRNSIQAIGMYQHSRNHDLNNKFAKYFLPSGNSSVLVSGDANAQDEFIRDVRAEWLNLPDNFRGFLTMAPEQSQAGVLFEYNQDLAALIDLPFLRNSHISLIVPFVHAENNLHLGQNNIQNPGTLPGRPKDIIGAFRQPNWRDARIDGKTELSRFPEVRIQFWRTYMDHDDMQLAYYSSLIIPTNIKPDPTFLFNATTGNGGHAGLNAGVIFQVLALDTETCGRIDWFLDLDATFRFHNHQWRTYDLKEKPWSRYLLFAKENRPLDINIPGVNVLTVPSKVRSYGLFDFVTGLRYRNDWGASFELSYNAWGHSEEHVQPQCRLKFSEGIMGDFTPGDLPVSASQSTIATRSPNDLIFIPIQKSDLDIHSVAAGSALTNSFNAAGGIERSFDTITVFAGLGGFVEYSTHNRPLPSWGAWGKIGASF